MNIFFLESAPLTGFASAIQGGSQFPVQEIGNLAKAAAFVFAIITFAFYLYLSIVYHKIGKKANLSAPGVAWMPYLGPVAVIFEASRMHWWPFLVLGGLYPLVMISSITVFLAIPALVFYSILVVCALLVFLGMTGMWHWKTYEAIGKPGWWILVPIVLSFLGIFLSLLGAMLPLMGVMGFILLILGMLSHLVLIGIAAWSE